jgi:hypothetical protein
MMNLPGGSKSSMKMRDSVKMEKSHRKKGRGLR